MRRPTMVVFGLVGASAVLAVACVPPAPASPRDHHVDHHDNPAARGQNVPGWQAGAGPGLRR